MNEPLADADAKKLIRSILTNGTVSFTGHAKQELANDNITTADAINVLRGGSVDPAEWENGSWRYRVRTNTMTVVVAFRAEDHLVVVTAWRKK